MPPVPKGDWNHVIVVLGVPRTGKSVYALRRSLELSASPAYTIAYDPGWRIPDKLPDGKPVRIHRHLDVNAAARGLATNPGGVHCIDGDGARVLQFGKAIGQQALQRGNGHGATPTLLFIDEGLSIRSARCYRLGEDLAEILSQRRHLHLGVILTAQSACLIHYEILGLATELVLFKLPDQRSHDRLAQVGVPQEILDKLPTLPNYSYIKYSV